MSSARDFFPNITPPVILVHQTKYLLMFLFFGEESSTNPIVLLSLTGIPDQ